MAVVMKYLRNINNILPSIILKIKVSLLYVFLLHFLIIVASGGDQEGCHPRYINGDKNYIVCVCNEEYCDKIGPVVVPEDGYLLYTSNKEGKRLESAIINANLRNVDDEGDIIVTLNKTDRFQRIIGFGGAFTDAAGINIVSLSKKLQDALIKSYYGHDGIGYSLGRIPIGGCDFSTHMYTYADEKIDANLSRFSLQNEDHEYKIPYILQALTLEPRLKLFGSPWTAPPWMKTNNDYKGRGVLKKEYWQLWADYIVKFVQSYKSQGIDLWGLTPQNEPLDGLIPFFPFNCMGWSSEEQRDWIKNHLGPTLTKNGLGHIKLIVFDDSTLFLQRRVDEVLSDPQTASFVSGVGIHWYSRGLSGYEGIKAVAETYPDKFILATEACNGFLPWERNVELGSWGRGEEYAEDIMQGLNHGSSGWTDWNLALDTLGGPNWAKLGADAPVIVDKTKQEFYKQPTFYTLAHFAKFLTPGSQILSTQVQHPPSSDMKFILPLLHEENTGFVNTYGALRARMDKMFQVVSAIRPDGSVVVVFFNKNDRSVKIKFVDDVSKSLRLTLSPRSLTTMIYNPVKR